MVTGRAGSSYTAQSGGPPPGRSATSRGLKHCQDFTFLALPAPPARSGERTERCQDVGFIYTVQSAAMLHQTGGRTAECGRAWLGRRQEHQSLGHETGQAATHEAHPVQPFFRPAKRNDAERSCARYTTPPALQSPSIGSNCSPAVRCRSGDLLASLSRKFPLA